MQDRDLYAQILGVREPWRVDRVELRLSESEVNVHLKHDEGVVWPCPECGRDCALYDHQPGRRWRHLDTCQYRTILHAEPPRTNCPEHGVRNVRLLWAEPSSRFTALFERLAIDWMKIASQKAVGDQLHLSWDEVHAIQERAVTRGLARRKAETVTHLGVDEKSFTRGHRYFTLVNDLERSRVLYVAEDRSQASLDGFWSSLTESQIAGVEAVAMDMWDPYINSTLGHLRDAEHKIVFDKFHIAKHLSEGVDLVRRRENKQLRAAGDDRLTGTRYDWLRHPAKMEPKDRREFKALRDSSLKTARAWALKESMMAFFSYVYERPARKHFRWWHNWAVRSRLKPMLDKARMIKRRFENIVTYLKHRITNAASESINSKIQWVKYTARGFRNQTNFKTAIYFHCGGLDLMPAPQLSSRNALFIYGWGDEAFQATLCCPINHTVGLPRVHDRGHRRSTSRFFALIRDTAYCGPGRHLSDRLSRRSCGEQCTRCHFLFNIVFPLLFAVLIWAPLVLRNRRLESILFKGE